MSIYIGLLWGEGHIILYIDHFCSYRIDTFYFPVKTDHITHCIYTDFFNDKELY